MTIPSWLMIQITPWQIIVIVIILLGFTILVIERYLKAHRLHVAAGKEDMVGRTATAENALTPKGVVLVEGERWTAISETGNIEPEEEVIITKVEGLKLRVTKKNKEVNK